MSTASEGIPTDHATRTGKLPGALTMMAATALGGVLVSRMNKTPLVLAAGAAALALLNRKKASTAAPQIAPPRAPEPLQVPPVIQPQSQIEQWLAQQIHREENAPVVALVPAGVSEPEDDYIPQCLLSDDTTEVTPLDGTFESLTEPVFRLPKATPPRFDSEAALPVLQALESTESSPTSDGAWILGVEPLPSLNASETSPALVSGMFSSEPVLMSALAPAAVYTAPVFEGGSLPDEIEVAPDPERLTHLTPSRLEELSAAPKLEEVIEEAPIAEVLEIPVQIAAAGEASFDPPLVLTPDNPWAPPVEVPPPTLPTPVLSPVIEAEIILRPRAPTQVAVMSKSQPVSSRSVHPIAANGAPAERADSTLDHDQSPPPQEQPSRTTWSSWWRGD